jgi:uncharacterized membrane protein YdjX (TVP38/TMEM64 family)
MKGHPAYTWLRGLLFIASLVVLGYVFQMLGIEGFFSEHWINLNVRGHGLNGELLFLGIGAVATALGVPRQVVAFFAGYAFGAALGSVLGALAAWLGCVLTFSYARAFGRRLVRHFFTDKINRFDRFVQGSPFTMTLLMRLLPAGSNLVTNLVAGVSRISKPAFFSATLIGYIPQTVVFALAGSGLNLDPSLRFTVAAGLFVISGVLGITLYRRLRHGRSYMQELEGKPESR